MSESKLISSEKQTSPIPLVVLENVSFKNNSDIILDNISFRIDKGDFFRNNWSQRCRQNDSIQMLARIKQRFQRNNKDFRQRHTNQR